MSVFLYSALFPLPSLTMQERDRFVSGDARRTDDRKWFVVVSKILVSGARRRFDVYSTTKSNSSNSRSSHASTAQNIRTHKSTQRIHTNTHIPTLQR